MELHKPVLVHEVLQYLYKKKGGRYVDGTLGMGGHTLRLLELEPTVHCLGLDCDEEASGAAKERLKKYEDRITIIRESYANLPPIMKDIGWNKCDGIFLDLGVSSLQLEQDVRGFSFRKKGPLDMRMDRSQSCTALALIKHLSQNELTKIIDRYGEEKFAQKIAFHLKKALFTYPQLDTVTAAEIIKNSIPKKFQKKEIHPATKTFQALRIAVNHELDNLKSFLDSVPDLLEKEGRLVLISFHSLEDRIIKEKAVYWKKSCICPPNFPQCICGKQPLFNILTQKPVLPTPQEVEDNPRSRSAKLRALERC